MTNTKTLPDIQGTEAISATWRRLLVRDRNVSNFFSGNSFTTDQTSEDIGRPNWRTDLNRLFIFDGTNFVSLWKYLTPDEIAYNIDHPDIPEGVENVRQVLDIIVNRNNLNTITMPAEGTTYIADGVTTDFELSRYTSNKFSVYIFIDGVKQNPETYELSEDGLLVKFKRAPANGESIEIMQLASLAEWDYSPIIKNFVGDGANKTFDMGVDVLNTSITSVNVNGREYQKSEFSLDASGRKIVLENAPEEGAKVQISITGKTSFVTVSPNSIGTEELKDGSVTVEKLAGALPINVNNIEDGSLTTRMIANKAITSAKLNDSAVTTTKINNRTVTEDKLSDDVKGRLLSTGNVTTNNLSDKVVTESKLSDDVKGRLLSTGNVTTSNLGNGSVTKEKLSSAVVGEIEGKQEKLIAGENIKIEDNTISVVGAKASWGKIEGNILDQTDLVTEMNTKANDTNVVHKTGNESISGTKTFNEPIIATIKSGYGGFEYAQGAVNETDKYCKLFSIESVGAYNVAELQAMVNLTNKDPSIGFMEIKTRVHDKAGKNSDSKVAFSLMTKEFSDVNFYQNTRLYYWNDYKENTVKYELWMFVPAWTTATISVIDTISRESTRRQWNIFNKNNQYDGFPTDASGYIQATLNVLKSATPTEDTTTSTQVDTVGARNTKLQNYALSSDVKNTYLEKAQQGVVLPNFDVMPVIATYEYDVATTTYQQLFTRTNTETKAIDLQDIVYCRIYVTGTNINAKYDCAFLWKGRENTPIQILAFSYPGTLDNNLTGIRYLRSVYPKSLNNGYQYIIDFQTYNTTARHIKVEVFKTNSKITWMSTATNSTYNSSGHNTNQCPLSTNYGICGNDTFYWGVVNNASWAGSISSNLNKYTVDNAMPYSGAALLANQFTFMNGNKIYPATNKTLAIEPGFGIVFNNLAYNNNVAVGWDRFKEKVRITSLTNIPHDTLARGENCYFRCTTDENGNIYSDNYVTNKMTPGYTWYYVGLAESNTTICLCTTNSHFLTLDTDGKLTAVDGKVVAVPDTSAFATKTELNNKADKSEVWTPSSSTSAQKETIISWGIPNYNASYTLGSFPFTAPKKCLFTGYVNTVGAYVDLYANINGVNIKVTNTNAYSHSSFYFVLDKGDVITFANYVTASNCTIIPLKGAN